MEQIISFDIKANMGFLKKPDINEGIFLTFNMLHKPALLGILGAIIGLEGYRNKGELPQYYQVLKNIPVGIQPLHSQKGNYAKTTIKYNNGVGYASKETGGNLIITEQVLLHPEFRCFLRLDYHNPIQQKIGEYLRKHQAEYLPYFGKNEFSLWWENFTEYEFTPFVRNRDFSIATIFSIDDNVVCKIVMEEFDPFADNSFQEEFIYFERLPIKFDDKLLQYEYRKFSYTNYFLKQEVIIENVFQLGNNDEIIQLF